MSKEQQKYLKKIKLENIFIQTSRILILLLFIIIWEYLSNKEIINSFIFSSPSKILKCLIDLYKQNNLFIHIYTTLKEIVISFILGSLIGFILALILYYSNILKRILDPFITVINSMPKVSLGPLLIIWLGANTNSIITMGLLINIIPTLITIYNGLINTDKTKIKLFKTLGANNYQILTKLLIPHNKETILSSLKLNISMSLIGIITGEFLVSKQGIGYLILYGTQVFNLNLVMTGIFLILIISYILYKLINTLK